MGRYNADDLHHIDELLAKDSTELTADEADELIEYKAYILARDTEAQERRAAQDAALAAMIEQNKQVAAKCESMLDGLVKMALENYEQTK